VNHILEALPSFTADRGTITFVTPVPNTRTPEQLAHDRAQGRRLRAWAARTQEFCTCRWHTDWESPGYMTDRYRVDGTDCPVHGYIERRYDD
jgi:hypothetical protein